MLCLLDDDVWLYRVAIDDVYISCPEIASLHYLISINSEVKCSRKVFLQDGISFTVKLF